MLDSDYFLLFKIKQRCHQIMNCLFLFPLENDLSVKTCALSFLKKEASKDCSIIIIKKHKSSYFNKLLALFTLKICWQKSRCINHSSNFLQLLLNILFLFFLDISLFLIDHAFLQLLMRVWFIIWVLIDEVWLIPGTALGKKIAVFSKGVSSLEFCEVITVISSLKEKSLKFIRVKSFLALSSFLHNFWDNSLCEVFLVFYFLNV